MAWRDLLLFLSSYPRPTPPWAVEAGVELARRLDARLSCLLCRPQWPLVSNWLADRLTDAGEAIAAENAKSRAAADVLQAGFLAAAGPLAGEVVLADCTPAAAVLALPAPARSYDLTIVPAGRDSRAAAEALIFGSGRPVLLLPEGGAPSFDTVAIGWDGSRPAARALADALPVCRSARAVRLLQVTGEKEVDAPLAEPVRHLARHGIAAACETIAAGHRDAGTAILDHAAATSVDLLVIGAYGHSRAREFVLGGATRSIMFDTRLPVLLSH